MNLYNYDDETKEYLNTSIAEADPEETKKQGKFVPLIPANSTEKQIPNYNSNNQIPVFEDENWVIKSDYRKNYYKVNNDLDVEEIDTIGEQDGFIIVDKVIGEDIKQNPDWYKIILNTIIKKTESEYEQEQENKRTKEFYNNFVVTSWGAFRKTPQGYSSAVEAVNTIFNMVNVAQGLTEDLANLLIFYEVPDFKQAKQCTEEWLVSHQKKHEPCDLQTFMTWYLEFQKVWASTQYTDIPIPEIEL